jgi:hypothetical protein
MKSKVIASTFLLGALLLTGCGAATAPASDNKDASAAASPSSTPTPAKKTGEEWMRSNLASKKPGTTFDTDNSVALDGFKIALVVLDHGIVGMKSNSDTTATFVGFDGIEGWTVPTGGLSRIIWDNKEYLVSRTTAVTKGSDQTLDKTADKSAQVIKVYDTETGKVVKEHVIPVPTTPSEADWVRPRLWHEVGEAANTLGMNSPHQNGLLFSRETGNKDLAYKTVNPLTGETIKEFTVPQNPKVTTRLAGVTAAGDFVVWAASSVNQDSTIIIPGVADFEGAQAAVFDGKFLFAERPVPDGTMPIGLVYDGATGKPVSDPDTSSWGQTSTSPNGRYVYGVGKVLDTQTKKVWKSGQKGQVAVTVVAVDDNGVAYTVVPESSGRDVPASTAFGYQVNVADGSSSAIGIAPSAISRGGFAVYQPDKRSAAEAVVVVPFKK